MHTEQSDIQDHAGHIFGVESPHMVDKLEQYNKVLEVVFLLYVNLSSWCTCLQMILTFIISPYFLQDVISVLQNQSFPGGLHEDTLLLVMGDHGQTLNGDHGGGTAEEVDHILIFFYSCKCQTIIYETCLYDSFCTHCNFIYSSTFQNHSNKSYFWLKFSNSLIFVRYVLY